MSRRFIVVPLLAFVLVGVLGTAAGGDTTTSQRTRVPHARSASGSPRPVRRVLIFSLPHVSWADVQATAMPNLRRLLETSGVAALTTRSEQRATRLADGYLTLGAGTRAVGDPATDGDNLEVNEQFGNLSAAAVFAQRTGRTVRHGIVSLAEPRIIDNNDALLFDAQIGALPEALRAAGFRRAVIANGDGQQADTPPNPGTSLHRRQAALALMLHDGTVQGGRVDGSLLQRDRAAPFGVRLDERAVTAAFVKAWQPRSVVLVEASDLVREDVYRPFTSPLHRAALLGQSLRRSDHLLGRLLKHVDLRRDAVVVVGPAHASQEISLTVLGVHAPGVEPGLLRSATTRRSGFVQLIDVAPSILQLTGVARPTSMEGRPVEVGRTGGSLADRIDLFVREDAAAQFRDDRVGEVQTAFVVLAGLLMVGSIWVLRRPRRPWAMPLLGRGALGVLGFVPAVFLARLFPLYELGLIPYWSYLVVVAALLGTIYHRIGRADPVDAILAGLIFNITLLVVDVLIGTPLAFNSALGYSPTVAGRFAGFSNPAYAAVGASAVLAAPLIARRLSPRLGDRRSIWIAVAFLAAIVFVDGAPFWGSDVGGILSMVPAFGITAVLMLGWRVRWRTVLWCVVGVAVAIGAFTALDVSRPPDSRTHLARLVLRIHDRGIGDFIVILQRKLGDNLLSLTNSVWGFILPIVLVLALWLVRRAPERLAAIRAAAPEATTGLTGFAILAVLGYALNDSGIAIPGVMLSILVSCTVWLLTQIVPSTPRRASARPARVGGSAS